MCIEFGEALDGTHVDPAPGVVFRSRAAARDRAKNPFAKLLYTVFSFGWRGGNNQWSSPANWTGVAPLDGQVLTFSGTTRQSSTNDLLASVGRIVFGNGGFTLAGSPVSLQWGLLNQSGDNTWAIASTLLSDQSFTSDSGTLAVNGTVNNGGNTLTLDGAGNITFSSAVSGSGALLKTGTPQEVCDYVKRLLDDVAGDGSSYPRLTAEVLHRHVHDGPAKALRKLKEPRLERIWNTTIP